MAFHRGHLSTVLAMETSKSKISIFGDQEREREGGEVALQRGIK
jgi:hypothetical protein